MMSYLSRDFSTNEEQAVIRNFLAPIPTDNASVLDGSYYSVEEFDETPFLVTTNSYLICLYEDRPLEVGRIEGGYALGCARGIASTVLTLAQEVTGHIASISEMVNQIKETFGLTVVQISSVLGISRPAIYNHIAGKVPPTDFTAYELLYAAALQVGSQVDFSLKPGLTSVLIDGNTLLRHLKESYRDTAFIVSVSRLVAEKLREMQPTIKQMSISDQRRAVAALGKSG